MLDMILVFLNLPRLALWPRMWSVLENVLCALEKNVYFSVFRWSALQISIKSIWSNVSFKACVSLLIFCLDDLSIDESGVLKSPPIIVLLSISPFMAVSICLIYWGASLVFNQRLPVILLVLWECGENYWFYFLNFRGEFGT